MLETHQNYSTRTVQLLLGWGGGVKEMPLQMAEFKITTVALTLMLSERTSLS